MIEQVIGGIDATVGSLAQSNYGALAGDVGTLLAILGGISFLLLTINMIIQVVPIGIGGFTIWAAKFILITAAASSWAFFEPIYDSIINLADGGSALLLGGETLTGGLQNTSDQLWSNYDTLSAAAGFNVGLHLTALIIALVAIALTCAAVVVIGISKMGLALALGLAPLFIMSLMFRATSDLFGAWTKVTLSFALTIILTSGIVAIVTSLLSNAASQAAIAVSLQDMLVVIVTAVSVTYIMVQAPSYAMALAGSIAAGGISTIAAATGTASAVTSAARAGSKAKDATGSAYTAGSVARSMGQVYSGSRAEGHSPMQAGKSMARAYKQAKRESFTSGDGSRMRAAARKQRPNPMTEK